MAERWTDPDLPISRHRSSEGVLRRIVLIVLGFSMIGTFFDLIMTEHYAGWRQQIPLVVLGITISALIGHGLVPSKATVRIVQCSMALLTVAGFAGFVFHYQTSAAFQLEVDETLTSWRLARSVLRATAPPAMAPLSMVQIGCVGLACMYRHPLGDAGRLFTEERNSL